LGNLARIVIFVPHIKYLRSKLNNVPNTRVA
jgi:hypothetical protein